VKILDARDIIAPLTALASHRPLPHDVRTLAEALGTTERTLRYRCRKIGTTPKACLDFVRCLRIVASETCDWNPSAQLFEHYADGRTVKRLMTMAGLAPDARPTVAQFLDRQQLLATTDLRTTLRAWFERPAN
jgi:hypothetical protein